MQRIWVTLKVFNIFTNKMWLWGEMTEIGRIGRNRERQIVFQSALEREIQRDRGGRLEREN